MNKILCPSLLNLDVEMLKEEVIKLDKAGIDIFHLDLMDGNFVPNFGLSLSDIDIVRRNTSKLIDIHLMIDNPQRYIKLVADHGCDIIYIHPESDLIPTATLQSIKDLGKKAGLVINPGTSLESIKYMYPLIDYLMIMTVNPGFCGQLYMDYVEPKIEEALIAQKEWGFHLLIDGGVDKEVMQRLSKKGLEGYVIGNLILFKQEEKDYEKLIKMMREL